MCTGTHSKSGVCTEELQQCWIYKFYQVNLGPSPYSGFADTQGENGFQECSHKSCHTAAWALYGCKSRGLTSATTLPYNHPPANETSDISSYLISDSLFFSLTFHLCLQSEFITQPRSGALYLRLGISKVIIRVRGWVGWRGTKTGGREWGRGVLTLWLISFFLFIFLF